MSNLAVNFSNLAIFGFFIDQYPAAIAFCTHWRANYRIIGCPYFQIIIGRSDCFSWKFSVTSFWIGNVIFSGNRFYINLLWSSFWKYGLNTRSIDCPDSGRPVRYALVLYKPWLTSRFWSSRWKASISALSIACLSSTTGSSWLFADESAVSLSFEFSTGIFSANFESIAPSDGFGEFFGGEFFNFLIRLVMARSTLIGSGSFDSSGNKSEFSFTNRFTPFWALRADGR